MRNNRVLITLVKKAMTRDKIIQCLEPIANVQNWADIKLEEGLRNAAVLVPLVQRKQWHVLLTKRTDHLRNHPGQISFPGGREDTTDASPIQTALRETEEEVGIQQNLIDIAGVIEPYLTVTNFNVVPIVGFVDPAYALKIDTFEVEEAFEVPLSALSHPDLYQKKEIFWQDQWRAYWELSYKGHRIWGATAGMLYGLSCRFAT